jgi:NAD-dependent deacetylase
MIKDSGIFVLTGAGISAESGIPVFQGANWRGRSHYELANIEAWNADPELVWEYYSERRQRALAARANLAHFALAEWEKMSASFMLCTQNVDGLHEEAGSSNVIHVHGRLFESRCADDCGRQAIADRKAYNREALPHCECGALLRPNVCWFGEQPYDLDRVYQELENCKMLLTIGTSGNVQPVASFVGLASRRQNVRRIYVGLDEPANAHFFDEVRLGPASTLVPELVRELAGRERG